MEDVLDTHISQLVANMYFKSIRIWLLIFGQIPSAII